MNTLRVGLLGCGVVGTSVARALIERRDELSASAGHELELRGIFVRSPREVEGIPSELFTQDAAALVDDSDLVIEVIGGQEIAAELVERALAKGADVVTANKELIASQGVALEELAAQHGATLCYEAAVVAAVPVIRVVGQALAGDRITSIRGVINGSTNFVLDRMRTEGQGLDEAMAEARDLGYLEADPSYDIDGHDAAAKLAILARLAFGAQVTAADVEVAGIREVDPEEIADGRAYGMRPRLVATALRGEDGEGPTLAVGPEWLGGADPLYDVEGRENRVVIETEAAGRLILSGAGAGGPETASAILGDVVMAGRGRGRRAPSDE